MHSTKISSFDSLPDRIQHGYQSDHRHIVVVEGDADKKLFTRLFASRYSIYIAGSRSIVINTVEALHGKLSIAGCLDRDFDNEVNDASLRGLPVFSVPQCDIEAALVDSAAFDRVVNEYASDSKLFAFGGVQEVRDCCLKFAKSLGAIRRVNSESGGSIDFGAVNWEKKIDRGALACDGEQIASIVSSHSSCHLDPEVVRAAIADQSQRYRGKDALVVLSVGLRRAIGTHAASAVTPDLIGRALRLQAEYSPSVMAVASALEDFLAGGRPAGGG